MLEVILLPLLALGMLSVVAGSFSSEPEDDTDMMDPADPVDPVDPVEPVDPATLGATFEATEDGVSITFGENETGSLAVITYVDTEEDAFPSEHEARYYLVPEGVTWPDNTSETSSNIPGSAYGLAEFEKANGLTLLGTVDLLEQGNDSPTTRNMADALPELTANVDADYFYLEANTHGIYLISFLQEGWLETRNDATQTIVTEDTVGTNENEWFVTETEGLTLDGGRGDDTLEAWATGTTLVGGDGNDDIIAANGDASIFGGAGNDTVDVVAANPGTNSTEGDDDIASATVETGDGDDLVTVYLGAGPSEIWLGEGNDQLRIQSTNGSVGYGGAGDDALWTWSGGEATLYGGEGDDALISSRPDNGASASVVFGGQGDDYLSLPNGAQGFGGSGNDDLSVSAGATAYGGEGNDTLWLREPFGEEAGRAILSGGSGVDVYNIEVQENLGTATDPIFAEITDFDPETEVLQISADDWTWVGIDGISITEDPGGAFTDIEVSFTPVNSSQDPVSTIIRLTGATGVTMAQIAVS